MKQLKISFTKKEWKTILDKSVASGRDRLRLSSQFDYALSF